MNDQIPAGLTRAEAKAVREWAERARGAEVQDETVAHAARVLLAVLPRPTMADMPEEERPACRRLQCDAGPAGRRGVITRAEDWHVYVVDKETGEHRNYSPDLVIPRPDLPRMEWPSDKKPAPAPTLPEGWLLADHQKHGRVLVVRVDGENVIFGAPFKATGIRTHVGLVSDLTFLDTDNQTTEEA